MPNIASISTCADHKMSPPPLGSCVQLFCPPSFRSQAWQVRFNKNKNCQYICKWTLMFVLEAICSPQLPVAFHSV